MKEYIFGERNRIPLSIAENPQMFREASRFVANSPGKAGRFFSWAPNAGPGSGRRRGETLRCVFRDHRWLVHATKWATLQNPSSG